MTAQGDQGRGGSMALIGRPGRASSPADARHRGGDGLAYRALCGDVQHGQALGFRRRRQGVTRQLPNRRQVKPRPSGSSSRWEVLKRVWRLGMEHPPMRASATNRRA